MTAKWIVLTCIWGGWLLWNVISLIIAKVGEEDILDAVWFLAWSFISTIICLVGSLVIALTVH